MNKNNKLFKYKYDIIFAISIITISLILLLVFNIFSKKDNLKAEIWYKNELVYSVDLSKVTENEEKTFDFEGNQVVIEYKHNAIRVKESPCHEQICYNQGWTNESIKPIICLDIGFKIIIASNDYDIVVG